MDAMRVAISAPDGTPYAAGFFIFDVRFPPQFPAAPPSVQLLTTGRNTVRFNPNLYECGKVCLSLLGTWEGREGETWCERTSTLLQVLVSIQALIFVPDPYYNEPGFEAQMGTPLGNHRAATYAAEVKQNAIKWGVIDPLRNPDPAFADVIKLHFRMRKVAVLADLDASIANAERRAVASPPTAPPRRARTAANPTHPPPPPHDPPFWRAHANTLGRLKTELTTLLDAL